MMMMNYHRNEIFSLCFVYHKVFQKSHHMMLLRRFLSTYRNNAMVLNCGSSSVKYQYFENDQSLVRGSIENIGSPNCVHKSLGSNVTKLAGPDASYEGAIKLAIASVSETLGDGKIFCVGHRVVHGGPSLVRPTLISPSVLEEIRTCASLAPLHNPSNIRGIELATAFVSSPQVACFDTAFHARMPAKAFRYAIPLKLADSKKIRRYGFHGLSYSYISSVVKESRMIVAHLGSGCSAAAIVNGVGIDTTMGFTPMEGLVMSTRAGTIDPGIIFHLSSEMKDLSNIMNKQSGLLGLSGGISSDMKTLLDLEQAGGEKGQIAHEAIEVFVYTVQKYIGQLMSALEYKVDAIVFTGGIGENSAPIRDRVLAGMTSIGVAVDPARNTAVPQDGLISMQNSKIRVYAVKTNEELQIARDSIRVVNELSQ